jgi:C-terminal processing protease CtpA/Prc
VNERGENLLISQVIPNEPAAKAGLQPNDVILAVNKTPITSYASLARVIKGFKPGDQVPVQVQRGEQSAEVVLTVGARRSSVADVIVAPDQDIAEIVAEVKSLKGQVGELTAIVEQLTQEINALKKR